LSSILADIGEANNDIAEYTPNPFYHYNNDTSRVADAAQLILVDGGEDLQNIPLHPLIQPQRAVDVIFAIDSSADTTYHWPNGTSLVASYERSLNKAIQNGTSFPAIPDQNTFINLGLNARPTFFGCNGSNTTDSAPLIVYVPNSPYMTYSNISTFALSSNNTQRDLIIQNGYDVATLGNSTLDDQWPICVACAVLSRSFLKTGTAVPSDCMNCFSRYCWNGTINSTEPSSDYAPEFKLAQATGSTNGSPKGLVIPGLRPDSALAIVAIAVGCLLLM
jgi:lysophospholipase